MLAVIWLVLYGGAIASIFFLAGYFSFKVGRLSPHGTSSSGFVLRECRTWRDVAGRICMVTLLLVVMICTILLLMRYGLSLRVYALLATFFVLFAISKLSIFRSFSYPWIYALVFAAAISGMWFFYPHWITTGAVSFFVAFFALILLKEISFKEALILSFAVILYDIPMVFLSGFIPEVAKSAGTTPIGVSLPPALWFTKVQMIGLGDIILPGILIMAAFREAKIRSLPFLPIGAIIGYFFGMTIAVMVLQVFDSQPATLYLIPGVFLGFWVALLANRVPLLSVLRGAEK